MKRIWQRLSKRERGLVVLTLFILLLVLGRYFLVSPFLERREWVKSQLELQPQLLEKNLRYISQKAEMEAGLERVRGGLKTIEASLLSGDTPSVSASALQEVVREIAAKEKVRIVTTRVLNPEQIGSLLRIPIRVDVTGEIDQVVNLIKGIDSDSKLLVVSEMNIRSLISRRRRSRRTVPQRRRGLRTSLVISGFARSQPTTPEKSKPAPTKTRS